MLPHTARAGQVPRSPSAEGKAQPLPAASTTPKTPMAPMTPARGLSAAEAAVQRQRFGTNEIAATEASGWGQALRSVATEPMFMLLLSAAGIYLLVGDLGEGLLLGAFALLSVGLVLVQGRRSARALQALRALATPQVRVMREGLSVRIPARELVPGDRLLLSEGDRLAADALLQECVGLELDESLLTGESVPVAKRPLKADEWQSPPQAQPGGAGLPWVFAGTLVVRGHGQAQVMATGGRTRTGGIGLSLAAIVQAPTPLQQDLRRLVAWLGVGAIALGGVLVLWYGLTRGQWIEGLLAGIAAAMGMLPEEFPMALTVFLALGAWRLARLKVLVRRPAVIEALGATTALCVDKTGTLTENRMALRRLLTPDTDTALPAPALPAAAEELLAHAARASRREGADPMDRALTAGAQALQEEATLALQGEPVREYPLQPGRLALTQAWPQAGGGLQLSTKGAPEAVAELCQLETAARLALTAQAQTLASQGLRVLGVAHAHWPHEQPPEDPSQALFEWLGLVAFEDPLRASVPAAVAQARAAGIAVLMITGDHPLTAMAIAQQAGIDTEGGVLTGQDVARLDEASLALALGRTRVFARMQPEQKLRLVEALRGRGEVVAMTGDGVNDAPALKAAHIGMAMGERGTDVAREAAAVVLLEDDFDHIVAGIRMGRRIGENLRKVMAYITAVHVPIAGMALLPLLLGWPPMLLPAHVVLMEMIIDPACSLAFEAAPGSPQLMQRPPRAPGRGLMDAALFGRALAQGLCLLGSVLLLYGLTQDPASNEAARTQALVALTVGNLGLVILSASQGQGVRVLLGWDYRLFWLIGAAALLALAAGLWLPGLRALLQLAAPSMTQLATAIGFGLAGVVLAGGVGRLYRQGAAPR